MLSKHRKRLEILPTRMVTKAMDCTAHIRNGHQIAAHSGAITARPNGYAQKLARMRGCLNSPACVLITSCGIRIPNETENNACFQMRPIGNKDFTADEGRFPPLSGRQWILGVPFSRIRDKGKQRIKDLVSVIYSRIQYLLRWGLYAFDRLVEEGTTRRAITYNNAIRSVAFLVDTGVPGFDALRLTHADIVRLVWRSDIGRKKDLGLASIS